MSRKRNQESARRAGLLRKFCFHWMQKHAPQQLLAERRRIDNVVKPRKKYQHRPGNEVGL